MTASCSAPDCSSPVYARGWCSRHYRQVLRRGELLPEKVVGACAVEGCGRRAVTRGWCHGHYLRWSRTGDVQADVPLARRERSTCTVDACDRPRHGQGLCRTHLGRWRAWADARPQQPVRSPGDAGWLSHGYRGIVVPEDLRGVTGGKAHDLEHRFVMALLLGRPLLPGENVHHRNGDRLDNRPENLELWTRRQPAGQRVADKVAFAYEVLLRYDTEAACALGLDLDPATGRPFDDESPAP